MGIILALILFSFIVFFHELGHFALAKKNGIDVTEFAIGMGPILLQKEYRGTRYCLKLLPLGGSCMMGEDEEATDSPNNFNNKSVWARISVIAAGPIFNFILAFIFAVILVGMFGYDEPVVGEVEEGYPAAEAGIEAGDRILQIGDQKVHIYRDISMYLQFHSAEDVKIVYERDGVNRSVTLSPKMDEDLGYGRIGIANFGNTKADILTALQYGAYEVEYWIQITMESLKMLVTGKIGVDQLSGPVGIVDVVDSAYQESRSYGAVIVFGQMLNLAILLSANLGVMNLLPLPALDGGRLIFLFLEVVRRRRVSPEKEGYVHMVGIVLLMILMVFVMYHDIQRVFF